MLHHSPDDNVPIALDTPKGQQDGEECDIINLRTLQSLAAKKKE